MNQNSTFNYRYETGWQGTDGVLENAIVYFGRKCDAMAFALRLFERKQPKATYIYDRCLNFTRWYDGIKWTRKQPLI